MSNHRYHYLYLPLMRFFSELSPAQKILLVAAKTVTIVSLILFQISSSSALSALLF